MTDDSRGKATGRKQIAYELGVSEEYVSQLRRKGIIDAVDHEQHGGKGRKLMVIEPQTLDALKVRIEASASSGHSIGGKASGEARRARADASTLQSAGSCIDGSADVAAVDVVSPPPAGGTFRLSGKG